MTRGQRVLLWVVAVIGIWWGAKETLNRSFWWVPPPHYMSSRVFYDPVGTAVVLVVLAAGVVAAYLAMRK